MAETTGDRLMTGTVIVLGAGTTMGVGGAVSAKFAAAGHRVVVTGRTQEKIDHTVMAIRNAGGKADAMVCDVTIESDLDRVFTHVEKIGHPVSSVIYNAGGNAPIPFEDITSAQFEAFWQVGFMGGFHTAKRAMSLLARQGSGSMLFTGASASLRGKPNYAHFSAAKGALRNLSQALAREYGPRGVHVAHIIIDGVVDGERAQSLFADYLDTLGEDGSLDPHAIAETFLMVHNQHRSAWTHELDLRPFKEAW
ncbi:SDR family NAD(P)-dependent oxidoreductase [Maricaulaceae bacterium MS644]